MMMNRFSVLLLINLLLSGLVMNIKAQQIQSLSVNVIPKPNDIKVGEGSFVYDQDVAFFACEQAQKAAEYFASLTSRACGFTPRFSENAAGRRIEFVFSERYGRESYKLEVRTDRIVVSASDESGHFYAVETLRQLLPADFFSPDVVENHKWQIPVVSITDGPRFNWRGLHLDVGRHFMPVEFIEKFIDLLAMHKMNVFHFHLTEDQGWRIEIKKYPALTQVGSWREGTIIGHKNVKPQRFDEIGHGGHYTQEQLRHIVEYAAKRHIEVIPEIEMPGHALAALAAYPRYSCTGGPHEVQKGWGIFDDIYCAGNEDTFEFLQDILDEVMDIFPSKYIHIGGDEAPKKRWKDCPKCRKRMVEEGLDNEEQLQSYFIKRIEKYLNSKGRDIIGWDEILEGGLAPNAAVMSWRGEQGGIDAANQGHKVVMTPTDFCYLDFYQSRDTENEPLAIGGFLSLEKAYSYEPIPDQISEDKRHLIMGIQGNIWTEYMKTPRDVEYMSYPRACALAEAAWTRPENKDEDNFKRRLETHKKRLDLLDVKYRE
jgi:hexosaminidase